MSVEHDEACLALDKLYSKNYAKIVSCTVGSVDLFNLHYTISSSLIKGSAGLIVLKLRLVFILDTQGNFVFGGNKVVDSLLGKSKRFGRIYSLIIGNNN